MVGRLLLFAVTALLLAPMAVVTEKAHASPLGLMNVLSPSPQPKAPNNCLQLFSCQIDSAFNFGFMKILHADLPEPSAAACSDLCQRHRPGTQLVMAKLISFNERLVCGCGGEEALRTPLGLSSGICSYQCPVGGGSCGGPTAVSVYQLNRSREECVKPQVTYYGCYLDDVRDESVILEAWERWPGGCVARCGDPPSSEARLVKMVTTYDGVTRCECW